MGGGIFT